MTHPRTNGLLDYQVMIKPEQYVQGNVSAIESSNNLEKLGVIELVARWKGHPAIRYYVHENDGRTRNAITIADWNLIEVLDPGHASNALKKQIRSWSKAHQNLLYGITKKIESWFTFLANAKLEQEERVNKWLQSYRHFAGDHS
jgi:hypothetical protein